MEKQLRNQIKIALTLVALFAMQLGSSQSNVMGDLVDENQSPVAGAQINLLKKGNIQQKTTSDATGHFTISIPEEGNYTIQATSDTFESYTKKITTIANRDLDLGKVTLLMAEEFLQSVEIVGRKRKDYNSDYSFSATKIAIKNKELPQSVATVTKELIDDKVAFQIVDAVKGVSSVTPVSFYNHFNIRGITQNQDGQIINGMRTNQYYFLQPLTQNIERVEVVKGPSSVTFSSTDPGGSINLVTKKPLKEARHEVSFAAGSFSTIRGGIDFTGPLNKEKTVLYRFNAAVQQAKSYRDLVQNNALLISPSLSYIPNDRTAVNVEMIYNKGTGNLDRGQPVFDEVNGNFDLTSTDISTNIAATNDFLISEEFIIMSSLSHRFTDHIQLNATYMKQTWKEDLQEHRANGFISDVDDNSVPNLVRFRYAERKQFWDTDNLNVFFTFDTKIGKIENKTVVGYDLNQLDRAKGAGQNGSRGYLTDDDGNTLTTTFEDIEILAPRVGFFDLNNPSNTIRNTSDYEISSFAIPNQLFRTQAAYIQNVSKIGNLTVLLSLRQEWFEDQLNYDTPNEVTYTNDALIPRVGLSYEINKNLNVYGTYLEGYQPQANTVSLLPVTANNFFWADESPSQFDALESNLVEFGLKSRWFDGAINASFAAFRIEQNNLLVAEEDLDAPSGFVFRERGSDRTQGIELDISGYILPNLQVSASYSYIDAIIEDDANPDLIGERKEATPEHSGNVWAKYDFTNSSILPGISIGAGVQHSGDKLGWYDRNVALPSYTLMDAALYYKPNSSKLEFTLKVNNLFNETYWTGAINNTRLFPGAPRNFILSTTYKF